MLGISTILTVDPLSLILNNMKTGYQIYRNDPTSSINHLLYMDDLKLYNSKCKELEKQIKTVHNFSQDTAMEFGIEKCAKISSKGGNRIQQENQERIVLNDSAYIKELDRDEQYKYLGILEATGVDHKTMNNNIRKEYYYRVRKILRTNLTGKNKITAINQLAVPVVQNSFGIINWDQKKIDAMDIKTRKLLTNHKIFYKQQCHARLYLPRAEGGIGLINLNNSHRATTVSVATYIKASNKKNMKIVEEHDSRQGRPQKNSVSKLSKIFLEQLQIENSTREKETVENPATKIARKTRKTYSKAIKKKLEEEWRNDKRAGRIKEELDKDHIDKEGSTKWLRNGVLQYDGERIMLAAQDQGLATRATLHLLKKHESPRCRFCGEPTESPSHLLSHCQTLMTQGEYLKRHNKVCSLIHWNILGDYNIERNSMAWEYQPERFTTNGTINIYYNKPITLGQYL